MPRASGASETRPLFSEVRLQRLAAGDPSLHRELTFAGEREIDSEAVFGDCNDSRHSSKRDDKFDRQVPNVPNCKLTDAHERNPTVCSGNFPTQRVDLLIGCGNPPFKTWRIDERQYRRVIRAPDREPAHTYTRQVRTSTRGGTDIRWSPWTEHLIRRAHPSALCWFRGYDAKHRRRIGKQRDKSRTRHEAHLQQLQFEIL